MLTAVYYSEKRENMILVQSSKKDNVLKVHSGAYQNINFREYTTESLLNTILDKEYELIGFYNE